MFALDAKYSAFSNELSLLKTRIDEQFSAEQVQHLKEWLQLDNNEQYFTHACVGSEYLAISCSQFPELFFPLIDSDDLTRPYSEQEIQGSLHKAVGAAGSEDEFDQQLRRHRRQFMVRIIWRDLNRLASTEQTTYELSVFAEQCVQAAIDYYYSMLSSQCGIPVSETTGMAQPMLVLGMGKLGAHELNLSSDIDLIFCFPENGNTQGGEKELSNQEFFLRLGQKVIKSLDVMTADGFVFRVDMRLRPWGQSGALVTSFEALEVYYQTQGREWERYAMVKARIVAENNIDEKSLRTIKASSEYQKKLMAILQPFTYRKYLDFSAIEALRSMKNLINKEVARKGLKGNVKLGAGGIREVEFVVQAFQLIRGGRDTRLRERQLLKNLLFLEKENYLPIGVPAKLAEAYLFLRDTEHAIQAYQDKQTQLLPQGENNQLRLAFMMGFDDWDSFYGILNGHMKFVSEQFQAIVSKPKNIDIEPRLADSSWEIIWQSDLDTNQARKILSTAFYFEDNNTQGFSSIGIDTPPALDLEKSIDDLLEVIASFKKNHAVLSMQATSRERLDQLMPLLLSELMALHKEEKNEAVVTLRRIINILESIVRRSAYIVLLLENPNALTQLVKLCRISSWISEQLFIHPALLDELLDVRALYSPPDIQDLRNELRNDVIRLPWDDLEAHMEALRYFRMSHGLRVAACEVSGILPLMKVSDYLTDIAEVILEHVVQLAWRQMVSRHGRPGRKDKPSSTAGLEVEANDEMDFIIVAYGKLGGLELGHGSDLDLVFVHAADISLETDGPRSIDNATFFARLGQKIIHILNTRTVSGQLYEIDMRLRPSGNSGLLVSSLAALEKYQRENAWVWEHQAMVRARVVAGSPGLGKVFECLRKDILSQERNLSQLKEKVVEMREKMREHFGSKPNAEQFNIKHDSGGIVDIEFMVQYAVLAWAHSRPELAGYTDNIRLLESLQRADLIAAETAQQLIDVYRSYRSAAHRLGLQGLPTVVSAQEFQLQRQLVQTAWQQLFY